jgi:mycoredoxin
MRDPQLPGRPTVTIYTTSTCGPCVRLKRALSEREIDFTEVNVELDDEAAEWVMDVNQGMRTVPTVLMPDGTTLTNPSADEVARRLASGAVG